MRTWAFAIVALMATGCVKQDTRLIGQWVGSAELPTMTQDQSQAAMAALPLGSTRFAFHFKEGGQVDVDTLGVKQTWQWSTIASDAKSITVRMSNSASTEKAVITFDGQDHFRVKMGATEVPLVFKRSSYQG